MRLRRNYILRMMGQASIMPLGKLPAGRHAVVKELTGGRGFIARLNALGITIGAEIEVIQNAFSGAMIIEVRGVRLALGRGEAERIIVCQLNNVNSK